MKIACSLLMLFLFLSCASAKETTYIGSTPANDVVRSFLGISLSDSVDFIRWKVIIQDTKYSLHCSYGIGKPNTNGFMNGGKRVELSGEVKKEKNYYYLQSENKALGILELNPSLLHLLNADKSLLVGNSGWSYTLSGDKGSASDQINVVSKQEPLQDSITFTGRTPCDVPGIIEPGKLCYKLKWYVVLYSGTDKYEPGRYKVFGTGWRGDGGRRGSWEIIRGKDDRIIYQLNDERDNGFIYLLKLDENILVFTDKQGRLLVGDEDFSFTLNRER